MVGGENHFPVDEEYSEDPIDLEELKVLDLAGLVSGTAISILADNFPECTLWVEDNKVLVNITEHIYTKYWWHKYHAGVFADAMIRAVKRLEHEKQPMSEPLLTVDEDVHYWVSWTLNRPIETDNNTLIESINAAYESVWRRASTILEDSDSVLILGKDTDASLGKLKRIAAKLEALGYFAYIIKELPDRLGESVIQKVLRYALSSKFVIIENTEPSGHLYEIPHVAKMAECITIVMQEEGKGATWMLEDAYPKYHHWHKLIYRDNELEDKADQAAKWADNVFREFSDYRKATLPWFR